MTNFGKIFSVSLLSAAVLSGCAKKEEAHDHAAAEKPKEAATLSIKIATEGAYKPFNYIDKDNKPQGFDIDLTNALCEELKAQCEIVTQDWDGIIPGLIAKKYDAIIAGMSITEERKAKVDFSDSYFQNSMIYIAKKDMTVDVTKLEGKKISAQAGTIAAQTVQDNAGDKNEVKTYKTQEDAYSDLQAGRVDLMFSDLAPAKDWLKSEAGSSFEQKGEAIGDNDQFGIAVRKGDPLKAQLDTALAAIKENGKYQVVYDKYFK